MRHKKLKIALIILAALCIAGASVTPLIVQKIRTNKKGRVVEGDTFNIVVTNDKIGNSVAANGKTGTNLIAYHNGNIVIPAKWTLVDGDNLPSPLVFDGKNNTATASLYIDVNNPNAYIWETKIWTIEAEYTTEAGETLTAQGKVKVLRSDVSDDFGILCLQNGTNISIPDQNTFNDFCVGGPSNTSITLAGQTFQKRDITHFQFGSRYDATTIVDEFLSNCINFNNELIIPSSVIEVGNNFLVNCSLFNSDINIDNLEIIGDNFMTECVKFNRSLIFSPVLPEIKNNFLKGCVDYNLPISFPASLGSIGDSFLEGCYSFNQNLIIPSTITSIGTSFLYKCDGMTSKVTINTPLGVFPSGGDPTAFATDNSGADSFVEGITIAGPLNNEYCDVVFPNNIASSPYRNLLNPINGIARVTFSDGKKVDVQNDGTNPNNPNTNSYTEFEREFCNNGGSTTLLNINGNNSYTKADVIGFEFSNQFNLANIPNNFLSYFTGLTSQLVIPDCVEAIGYSFMYYCTGYNKPLNLPYRLTTISRDFMNWCIAFNSTITLPNSLINIGNYFLSSCFAFNQPIDLPDTLVNIPNYFMQNCTAFNNTITFPQGTLTQIGTNFMSGCTSFNQPLNLAGTITSIGGNFLYECDSYTSTIDFKNIASSALTISNNNFATTNPSANSYTTGITIKGNNVDKIVNTHPNTSASPYRNLISEIYGVARVNLLDGSIIDIPASEFNKLSNHAGAGATTTVVIHGVTTQWDQIVGLEFTDEFNFDKIPASFLRNCTNFNQEIVLPTCVKELGEAFLMGATSYNKPIDFPEVEIIAGYFLAEATSFNNTISFPKLKNLGWRFLHKAYAYNQDLTLPMTLEEIGTHFMSEAKNMISSVEFGYLDPAVLLSAEENFATSDDTAPMYTTGITIKGGYSTVEGIIANNPNKDINPFRKIYDDNISDCYAELTLIDGSIRKIYDLHDFNTWLGGPTAVGNPTDVMYINQGTGTADYPVGGWPSGGPYSTEPLSQPYVRKDVKSIRFGKFATVGNPVTGDLPLTAIPDNFMYNCTDNFNSTIILPETVTTIGDNFLFGTNRQNKPIVIPNTVTSIGVNFLHSNTSFNSYINIPTGVTNIPSWFMWKNHSFDQPIDISNITSIGERFMTDCRNFNKKLTFNSGLTSIGRTFLSSEGGGSYGCVAFNQPLDFSSCANLTSVPFQFLDSNTSAAFNSEIKFHNNVTSIGQWFLNDANHYNQQFIIPTGINGTAGKIGSNFMEGLDAMISEVKFPLSANSDIVLNQRGMNSDCFTTYSNETNAFKFGISLTGSSDALRLYMNNPYRNNHNGRFRKLNQPPVGANTYARIEYNNGEQIVDAVTEADFLALGDTAMTTTPSTGNFLINGISIARNDVTAVRVYKTNYTPSWFMYKCINLKTVELSTTTRILRDHFLQECTGFNNTIVNLDKITETQEGFLVKCNSYNQPISFGSGLATIGNWFLSDMSNFNQPVNLSNTGVTVMSTDSLKSLPVFDSTVALKSNTTAIGHRFLAFNAKFNQALFLPNTISTIGDSFLQENYSFNRPVTMPTSLTVIQAGSFMRTMPNMTSQISFGNIPSTVFAITNNNWHFSVDASTDDAYDQGIYLSGTFRAAIIAAHPPLSGQASQNSRWRKWRATNFIYVTNTNGTPAGNVAPADIGTLTNGAAVRIDTGSTAPANTMRTISFGEDFNLTSIPNRFMQSWANNNNSFASDVRLPHCVRTIGNYFMAYLMWINSRDHIVSYPEYKIGDANINIGSYHLNQAQIHGNLKVNISATPDIEIPSTAIFINQDFICLVNGRGVNVDIFFPRAGTDAYIGGNSSVGWFGNGRNNAWGLYSFQMFGTMGGTGPASAGMINMYAHFRFQGDHDEWKNTNPLARNNPNRTWYFDVLQSRAPY